MKEPFNKNEIILYVDYIKKLTDRYTKYNPNQQNIILRKERHMSIPKLILRIIFRVINILLTIVNKLPLVNLPLIPIGDSFHTKGFDMPAEAERGEHDEFKKTVKHCGRGL